MEVTNASDQQGENGRQSRKKRTRTQATKSFLSTYDISSIKSVLTRKFAKFQVVIVQQQRQRSVQKACKLYFFAIRPLIFDKYTMSVLSFV